MLWDSGPDCLIMKNALTTLIWNGKTEPKTTNKKLARPGGAGLQVLVSGHDIVLVTSSLKPGEQSINLSLAPIR